MLIIPCLQTLSTEWRFSLGESPWGESEACQDKGDSRQKDEAFSDPHLGVPLKIVLIKTSAFGLLDHFITLVMKHSLPSPLTASALLCGLGSCVCNLLPRFYSSSRRQNKFSFWSKLQVLLSTAPTSSIFRNTGEWEHTVVIYCSFHYSPSIRSSSKHLVQFSEICLAVSVTNW